MTGATHAAAGAAIGAALAAPAGIEIAAAGAVVGGLAALLPDIDHPGSYAGRYLRPVACILEEKWGHRESPTHTLLFAGLAGLAVGTAAAMFLKAFLLALAGLLGGISHIVLDGMTRSGVKPYRVFLPKIPERAERWWKAGRRWNRFCDRLRKTPWAGRQWKGDIYTGQDGRETAVFAASAFCLAFVLLSCVK